MYIFLENILNIGRKELSSSDFDNDGHGLWNINFVDVSMAQLAKASMFSWATRFGAVPGSIPESKLTYNKNYDLSVGFFTLKKKYSLHIFLQLVYYGSGSSY